MSDPSKSVGQALLEFAAPFRSLQTARDARNLASVSRTTPPEEEQKAFDRLDRLLKSERPLRGDVPRGYYFNVRV